jgi:hypothetical protein
VTVAYQGGPVDDYGHPPGPWDLPVRRPTDFEDRTENVPIPHTEHISMCPGCAGVGRTACSTCAGSGRMNCPKCQGKGFIERQEMNPVKNSDGSVVQKAMTVRDNCTCMNGMVVCSGCAGNGRVTCHTCTGSGKVKVFQNVTIRFHAANKTEVHDYTDVPDNLVRQAGGEVVVDTRSPRIDTPAPVEADVDAHIDKLLRSAHSINEGTTKILFEALHVERVGIHEVHYRYAGAGHRLWVYGNERRIHAPKLPWQWQRLLWIILSAVGGLALVILLLVLLASH